MKDNPTRIFFVRHGKTSQTGTISYGRTKGIDLNDEGIKQAQSARDYLSSIDIEAVISSPLERAFQTAQIICEKHDIKVLINNKFLETDCGDWTGRKLKDLRKEKQWPMVVGRPSQFKFENGESFQDIFVRMNDGVNKLIEKYAGKNIVIVSHSDPLIVLMSHYLGMHMDNCQRILCSPASVSIVEYGYAGANVQSVGIIAPVEFEGKNGKN